MDPVAIPILAIGGAIVLIGMKMWLNAKLHAGGRTEREDMERLADVVEDLDHRVREMHDQFVELQERVDFAERLLSRGGATADPEDR